jgi:superoxide dismutase, Fe-Mn family
MYNFIKEVILNEVKSTADQDRLIQLQLRYAKGDLDPAISEDTINYHYGKLYKSYVDRYNKGEGDADFNEAGAFLHRIYFDQFQSPVSSNTPEGLSLALILKHYDDFEDFKSQVEKTAMTIQGSGWVYLARNGQIKTIKNHQIRSDIVLLIDWWEHAWALDYQADKLKYLNNTWRIIDWSVINSRLTVDLNQ